jgi:triosephosphate isomerase
MDRRRPLVTARDLEGRGIPTIPEGALLTPLARDLLRKRGVRPRSIARLGAPGGGAPQRLLVANWKSHKTIPEALAFARAFRQELAERHSSVATVICPPATALATLASALRGCAEVGAQDVSPHDEGAHTGELAPRHLVDAGARYALVGHSERRAAGESDAVCRLKVRTALRGGLDPILCVGETKGERSAGRAEAVVSDQLRAAVEGLLPDALRRLVVAYEPRWAIGQGVTPTPAEITAMLGHVHGVLARVGGEAASRVPVLYGGSVNEKNASELLRLPGCAGALVGGAALSPERFAAILGRM